MNRTHLIGHVYRSQRWARNCTRSGREQYLAVIVWQPTHGETLHLTNTPFV